MLFVYVIVYNYEIVRCLYMLLYIYICNCMLFVYVIVYNYVIVRCLYMLLYINM